MAKTTLCNNAVTSTRIAKSSGGLMRSRSLGGCATCRSRHAKCDEGRPSCLVCQKLGLVCEQYEIRLVFDSSDIRGSQYRRPLFTENMRLKMSDELVASVDPDKLSMVLMEMDERCETLEQQPGGIFSTHSGPFGAFRLSPLERESEERDTPITELPPSSSNFSLEIESTYNGDPLVDSFFGDFDLSITTSDLQAEGFLSSILPSPDTVQLPSPDLREWESTVQVESPSNPVETHFILPETLRFDIGASSLVPLHAPFLLSVYKDHGIRLFSPVQAEKSPWHILHLSSAMETLGQLTMGEFPGYAKTCSFFAILTTSSYLQRDTATSETALEYWQRQADRHALQAHKYLKSALHDASSPRKLVKYKDILIALLCMTTISAYQGNYDAIKRCMIDCENWIRFRGLPKIKKSRKARLLHHCYVYLRIFYESTSILPVTLPLQDHEPNPTPENPASATASPSFRLRQWEGRLDQRMNELKEPQLGENDLLLEFPGRWDFTMYPQIFGIPESLVFLLSQVTRLGNERDLMNSDSPTTTLNFRQFSSRARCLEQCITVWRPPSFSHDDQNQTGDPRSKISHMLNALHKALLVFFYRRIFDIEPSMLREKILEIKKSLALCDQEDVPVAHLAAAFVWTAFIAACEALDPTLQNWFTKWFEVSAARSGLQTFRIALNVSKKVWERRHLNGNADCSWPQVMQESGLNLFYI